MNYQKELLERMQALLLEIEASKVKIENIENWFGWTPRDRQDRITKLTMERAWLKGLISEFNNNTSKLHQNQLEQPVTPNQEPFESSAHIIFA